MDELNHLGWVVYKSFEFAGHLLGIRTNSEDVGDWLSHALGAYEVHDTEAEPVYSIWIPEVDDDSVGQRYLVLYREASDLLRTFDTARLAQRLIWELETFALRRRDDAVYLNAGIAGTEGATALIPSDIVPFIRLAGRRAERELNLPVAPTIAVDFDGSLRAVGDQLDVPADAATSLAELLGLEGAAEARELTVPQSVDFVCAFHYAPELPSIAPLTRAGAV